MMAGVAGGTSARTDGVRAAGATAGVRSAAVTPTSRTRAEPSRAALADAARLSDTTSADGARDESPAAAAAPGVAGRAAHDGREEPGAHASLDVRDEAAARKAATAASASAPSQGGAAASDAGASANGGASDGLTAGIPSLTDGAPTASVSRSTAYTGPAAAAPAAVDLGAGGVRERVRSAASAVADRRVLARGIDAEIDLGDAGRIQVRAERPELRIDIKLDADVAHTARTLAEHARDLSLELRTDARDARVTVSGPSTFTSASSNDRPHDGAGGGAGASAGGSSSNRDSGDAERRNARDGATPSVVDPRAQPRVQRRARFVL